LGTGHARYQTEEKAISSVRWRYTVWSAKKLGGIFALKQNSSFNNCDCRL